MQNPDLQKINPSVGLVPEKSNSTCRFYTPALIT